MAAPLCSWWSEKVVELGGQGACGRPAEVVGDDHDPSAAAQADRPHALGRAAVGTGVGMVDLDHDARS
jgi:hypothetical protein